MEVFITLGTQWRGAPTGGALGLDYSAVEPTLRMLEVPARTWGNLFTDLRLLERAALREMRS